MKFAPSVYEHAARFLNKSPWQVSRDEELMYKAHAAAYEAYRHEPITIGIDIYNLEAEAYGATVDEPSGNNIPTIGKPLYQSLDDLLQIQCFNPKTDGRLPLVIRAGKRVAEQFPQADVRIPVSGPFSIASLLLPFETLLIESFSDPQKVMRVLERLAENQLAFCEEIHNAGLKITFFESAATPPLVSPEQFRTIIMPVLKEMIRNISTLTGENTALIIGGDTTPILESILQTGAKYIICPSETDQKAFMQKMRTAPDVMVRINMDPQIIAYGEWPELQNEIERVLAIAAERHNVVIGTGVLPYDARPETVLKIQEYIHSL